MEYSINLVLSFFLGLFSKIYDDILDNKLSTSEYYVGILKYVIVGLLVKYISCIPYPAN